MRLLVTGGSGYLGRCLVPLAIGRFETSYTYFQNDPLAAPNGYQLNVLQPAQVQQLVETIQPAAIIHLAGSDRSPDMDAVVRHGAENITAAAELAGARLIHLSTDVLFDGRNPPYRESDLPSPVHAYGRAKAAAEQIVARHPDHVIIRTSLIYGLRRMDHATRWLTKQLKAGEPVTLFVNQFRQPVWCESLSLACLELVDHPYQGILNVAGEQTLNRVEFGLRMLKWWGFSATKSLAFGPASEKWPLDCRLDLTRVHEVLKTPLPGLDEVLARWPTPELTAEFN